MTQPVFFQFLFSFFFCLSLFLFLPACPVGNESPLLSRCSSPLFVFGMWHRFPLLCAQQEKFGDDDWERLEPPENAFGWSFVLGEEAGWDGGGEITRKS